MTSVTTVSFLPIRRGYARVAASPWKGARAPAITAPNRVLWPQTYLGLVATGHKSHTLDEPEIPPELDRLLEQVVLGEGCTVVGVQEIRAAKGVGPEIAGDESWLVQEAEVE